MNEFFGVVLSFPTVVYTTLLIVVLVYWLVAIVGLIDFNSGPDLDIGGDVDADFDFDAGSDVDAGADIGDVHHGHLDGQIEISHEHGQVSTLASYLVAIGLGGVPFSVVVSLVTIFSWIVSDVAASLLLPLVPGDTLRFAAGTGILVVAFALSLPISAFFVRPLRKLFVADKPMTKASLVGQKCRIDSGMVNEKYGRAVIVTEQGDQFHIYVVADTPNKLTRGSVAFVAEYDETKNVYHVEEQDDSS